MKHKALLLALGGFLWASPVRADFRPALEVSTGVLWGQSDEFVLRDGTMNNPKSRLVWDVPLSSSLEVTAVLPWTDLTMTRLSLTGSIPWFAGVMIDEDWNTSGYRYARSEHAAFLGTHWSARVEQRFTLDLFSFSLGAQYRWSAWEGWGGSGKYTYLNGTTSESMFGGLLIAYRQQWIVPYLGASVSVPTAWGRFGAGMRYGPYVWCNDMDNHNYANSATMTFLDYLSGGQYGQAQVEAEWPGGEKWYFGLRIEAAFSSDVIGTTYETKSQQVSSGPLATYPPFEKAAAAGFREASVAFFVRN